MASLIHANSVTFLPCIGSPWIWLQRYSSFISSICANYENPALSIIGFLAYLYITCLLLARLPSPTVLIAALCPMLICCLIVYLLACPHALCLGAAPVLSSLEISQLPSLPPTHWLVYSLLPGHPTCVMLTFSTCY